MHVRHLTALRSWIAYAALPLAGLVTAPILARALGPDGRGQLAAALQPLTVASAVAAFGLPTAVTFFIGRGYSPRSVVKIASGLAVISTAVVAAALYLYAPAVLPATGLTLGALLLVWLSFAPSAFLAIRRADHQASRNYRVIDLERFSGAVFRVVMILVLFAASTQSVLLYIVAYQVAGLCASLFLARRLGRDRNSGDRGRLEISRMAAYSGLASIGTIAVALNSRLDQAILPAAMSARELGFYSVAVTVAEVPSIIAAVSVRNLLTETSLQTSRGTVRRTFLVGLGATTVACVLLGVLSDLVVPIIFGSEFAPSSGVVKVLLASTILAYCTETLSAVRAGSGRPGLAALGPVAGAITTLVLIAAYWTSQNAFLAAVISVLSQFIAAVVATIVLRARNPSLHANSRA